ncbi:ATP-binding protein [Herbaspirillum sp. RV1423]|uniref:ATP-binding protein n=1 Tax=Herbaspirillum sp. RV1423 TaxID=1443993 RepID=UPI0004B1F7E3|nr:ATP-binding protein [Herbaspirillum sp. RV1423]
MSQIPFLVDTSRVLEIISSQIYDSPYAMARENVQNAYDAILMRAKSEGRLPADFTIGLTVTPTSIEIFDQGIGMSEQVLRENFWRAGSSGKNNAAAKAAGVIGTFGIGAMANFGVCEHLIVETRAVGSEVGLRTSAAKADLTIGQDCITLESISHEIPVGTKLIALLPGDKQIDVGALKNYLAPFVRFLPVPVLFNEENISQQSPLIELGMGDQWKAFGDKQVSIGRFQFNVKVFNSANQFGIVVENISIDGEPSTAGLWLRQGAGQIMGLRSKFGLAPLPLPSHYQLGGYADLPFLQPTAGREALTRESIQEATPILPALEIILTELIKDSDHADNSTPFQQHLCQLNRVEWAHRVSVQLSPGDQRVELGRLIDTFPDCQLQWFEGTDATIVGMFSNADNPLIRVSPNNPRRDLQQRYLREVVHLPHVPNSATISKTYEPSELTWHEVDLTFAIGRILRTDYLIDEITIEWVEISHGVPMVAETSGDRLTLKISRSWSAVKALLGVIAASPEVIEGMAKDFIRVHLYERIQTFVPSSQRAGLDALQKTLARRSELYRLELEDRGALEPLLADYIAGRIELPAVLSAAANITSGQTQRVGSDAVASVASVLHDVVHSVVGALPVQAATSPTPGSPILRMETEVRERLLIVENDLPQLNNHRMFLALSDKIFNLEREFFTWPHTTQVAWAGKRIVFLFGLVHSSQSLYYDIELRGNRTAGPAGGTPILTTTIVTKNRIFIPLPAQLIECFSVSSGPVEFFVRFDLLSQK